MSDNKDYREYYDIMDKIGEGSLAEFYKAKSKSDGETRVIKIIKKKTFEECYKEFDFSKIIKIMKILEGENKENVNTIKVFESFITQDEYVSVEDLYDEDLEQLRKQKNNFSIEEIKEILTQLNNTFKIMSNNKIVHRDIKPENIFIIYKNKEKSEFIVKLGEYIVSDFISNDYLDLCVGTKNFMSPEIFQTEKYNEKCDLWSLGIVIYLLCFNSFPYKISIGKIESYYTLSEGKELKKSGNEELDDLIRKLLVVDPKERIGWKDYFEHPFFDRK